MEKVIERFTDYFLRYTADVPADEVELHDSYSRDCKCQPDVSFDQKEGWHTIIHKNIEK